MSSTHENDQPDNPFGALPSPSARPRGVPHAGIPLPDDDLHLPDEPDDDDEDDDDLRLMADTMPGEGPGDD
ncbi:hypothetical protein IV454_21730 [Massilia antarctica]|uniref:Uncharacterized protein n=1 Tax=Massilia antarctica TaxID=2765360 RepID=A0AA49A6H1_9BURK|nr:hypothetical protein [Massilia antarctica]QPI48151.1 hypothetical protein IV454_21730 [Massilia antarctica]